MIDRTAYNALVDDTGLGLDGSIWNKAAIKNVLLDPIDAAGPTFLTSSVSGVQNALALALGGDTVIQWTATADLTLNGLLGGIAGRRVTIRNASATSAVIRITPFSASAVIPNQFSPFLLASPTPIAFLGTATFVHDGQYWRLITHDQGTALTVPYNAGNFATGTATVWTVSSANVIEQSYYLTGNICHVRIGIVQSTIANSGTATLSVNGWPITFLKTTSAGTPGWTSLSTAGWGLMQCYPTGGTSIGFIRPDFAAWPNSAGVGYFGFDAALLVN